MANTKLKKRPVALIILSGFGWSPLVEGNAVAQAYTPFLDKYLSTFKHTLLEASGECVGLPLGQAGNSEINHMIIGTGQVAPMTVTRVDEAIATGKFFENPTLVAAIDAGKDSALHLMGLLSDGGVHSRNAHLYALLKMAAERGVQRVFVHVFTDGRDTPPKSGQRYVEELMAKMRELGVGRIATVTGRYYAMDRDDRWERVKRAYDAIALGEGRKFAYPGAAIEASYDGGVTDEFIEPLVITRKNGAPLATTQSGDSVIFFNLRADRARQLTRAFTGLNFDSFERERIQNLHFATFTQYDRSINTSIIFPPVAPARPLAALFAEQGVANLRVAETDKYAHVTYFFNGGVEKEFPYESRILIASPQATAYDSKPEMSAFKITDKVMRAIDDGETDVYVVYFANADHVGVREVDDVNVGLAVINRAHDFVGDFERAHFRLRVVGRGLRRSYEDAAFVRKLLFDAAVEEISHVRVFFGLGDAQVGDAVFGEQRRERASRGDRRKDDRRVDRTVVLSEGGEV